MRDKLTIGDLLYWIKWFVYHVYIIYKGASMRKELTKVDAMLNEKEVEKIKDLADEHSLIIERADIAIARMQKGEYRLSTQDLRAISEKYPDLKVFLEEQSDFLFTVVEERYWLIDVLVSRLVRAYLVGKDIIYVM